MLLLLWNDLNVSTHYIVVQYANNDLKKRTKKNRTKLTIESGQCLDANNVLERRMKRKQKIPTQNDFDKREFLELQLIKCVAVQYILSPFFPYQAVLLEFNCWFECFFYFSILLKWTAQPFLNNVFLFHSYCVCRSYLANILQNFQKKSVKFFASLQHGWICIFVWHFSVHRLRYSRVQIN